MLKSQIKAGEEYAFREKPTRRTVVQRVRILQHVRDNKWKAEWIEPDSGLIHYVESRQLIAVWKGHKEILKEEAAEAALRKHNEDSGYRKESPIDNAVIQVFENVGDEVSFYRGCLTGKPDAIDRVKRRAGVVPDKPSPYSYIDRSGTVHIPFDEAFEIARKFCANEPAAVLASIEATEREWSERVRHPGEEYLVSLLNEYRASWALLRDWAGHDAAIAQREAHIEKLERLVWDAIYALQKAGQDDAAARLRRAMDRR
jgi:hypothetical protein